MNKKYEQYKKVKNVHKTFGKEREKIERPVKAWSHSSQLFAQILQLRESLRDRNVYVRGSSSSRDILRNSF